MTMIDRKEALMQIIRSSDEPERTIDILYAFAMRLIRKQEEVAPCSN